MRPFMAPGAYINYLENEADPRAREAYGANYERLAPLQAKYGPTSFFRMNHSIKSAAAATARAIDAPTAAATRR